MRLLLILFSFSLLPSFAIAEEIIDGFKMPESVIQDKEGNIYVSEIGERDVDKDGKITMIDKSGKLTTIVDDLYDPKGIVLFDNKLYVTDRDVVIEVDIENKTSAVYAGTMQFPRSPVFLNDIDVDDKGNLYVSDSGDFKNTGQIFLIKNTGDIETIFEDERNLIKAPNGLLLDGDTLYILDWGGEFFQVNLNKKSFKKIAEGFNGGDGIAKVNDTFFLSSWLEGKLYKLTSGKTEIINDNFEAAADISLSQDKKKVYIPDMKAGSLTILDVN